MKDLCARLPHGVNIQYDNGHVIETRELGLGSLHDFIFNDVAIKPYLRPMPSMTEEEKKKYHNYRYWIEKGDTEHCTINMMDWLNKHHFDYRGLIEKGLALEAPKGMYK